jgi:hypothetical protein
VKQISQPELLAAIHKGVITEHLANKHIELITEHQKMGTHWLWLHRSDPSRSGVPWNSPIVRSLRLQEWFQVSVDAGDPEEILAKQLRLVRLPSQGKIISLILPKYVHVRIRRKKAYVYAYRGGGIRWVVDPVIVTDVSEAGIAKALDVVIPAAPITSGTLPDLRDKGNPQPLRAVGIKSDIGSKVFELEFNATEIRVARRLWGRGRDVSDSTELLANLPPTASTIQIARTVLAAEPNTPAK